MIDRLYFASIISIPFLVEKAPGNLNRRFHFVIQRWLRPSTKSIWFQNGFLWSSVLDRCGELCFDLNWKWREARVWRECPVTRICTYTWTSRWSLVCFNEVLCFGVKSYFKFFELWLWAAYRLCSAILWVVCDEVVLAAWCSSSWLCIIYITAHIIYINKCSVSLSF